MDFVDQIFKNLGTRLNGQITRSIQEIEQPETRCKIENIEQSSQEFVPTISAQNSQILESKFEKLDKAQSQQLSYVAKQINDYESELNRVEIVKNEKEMWPFNYLYTSTNDDSLEQSDSPTNKLNYYKNGYDFNRDLPIYSHRDEVI
jgi:hypothetical protein